MNRTGASATLQSANTIARPFSTREVEKVLTYVDAGMPIDSQLKYAKREAWRICQTLNRIPPSTGQQRLLDVGCYGQWIGAYVNLLGYRDITGIANEADAGLRHDMPRKNGVLEFDLSVNFFDAEVEAFPYPDESFDVVVCCSMLEHLARDPMHLMSEINRVTRHGGDLVLQTPNSASLNTLQRTLLGSQPYSFSLYYGVGIHRHNREYTTSEIVRLMSNSGFEISSAETIGKMTPIWRRWVMNLLATPAALAGRCPMRYRGEVAMVVGRKSGPILERWPNWLYNDPWFNETWYRKHGGTLGRRRLEEWGPPKTHVRDETQHSG